MDNERLERQIRFILEADKMKNICRQTLVLHEDRAENDAEHSWHLALMAFLLAEYSNEPVDVCKVMKMVLVHDIVEIDAGDTYCYDTDGNKTKREREEKAADRLFGLLPDDQGKEMRELWEEFERCDTAESKFAAALDRMQPLMLNYTKGGISWKTHNVKYPQVIGRNEKTHEGSEELWSFAKSLLDEAKKSGILPEE